jgi:hypothetical protein
MDLEHVEVTYGDIHTVMGVYNVLFLIYELLMSFKNLREKKCYTSFNVILTL